MSKTQEQMLERLIAQLAKHTRSMQALTRSINTLAKSNETLAEAVLAPEADEEEEEEEGQLGVDMSGNPIRLS